MIAHIVLFRPRPDLTPVARESLVRAFSTALEQIPFIRRSRIGKRITHGRPYEALMDVDYQYVAVLEFDDIDGLKGYLEHAAHQRLAASFFDSSEATLIYDFDLVEDTSALMAVE